jgi:hypothetical protein
MQYYCKIVKSFVKLFGVRSNERLGQRQSRKPTMIKTQIVKEDNKPAIVIMDYKEYLRLKEIEEDRVDYYSASEVKRKNKKRKNYKELEEELGL